MVVLPINLNYFTVGRGTDCKANISWQAATESDLAEYILESSVDGINYQSVQKFQPQGASKNYQFAQSIESTQIAYYRLKIVEKNGTISYSPIQKLSNNCQGLFKPSIYPIPFKSIIRFGNLGKGNKTLKITSMDGKIMAIRSTKDFDFSIQVNNWIKGMYLVQITSEENGTYTQKILKE